MMRRLVVGVLTCAAVMPVGVAAETASFQYDALGRLVGSTLDHGTVTSTAIGYDAAGNRSSYQVQRSGSSAMAMSAVAKSNSATVSRTPAPPASTFKSAVIAPALSKFKKPVTP